ncbi:MAG: hypothetical protein RMJ65_04785 [candidate division WOR-3 bacterium]|nr:hypothetical protein [candidate division WOR-3 bacterium]MDW7988004.1 hypothetical protein [candidate division WOR-3 bacterium]
MKKVGKLILGIVLGGFLGLTAQTPNLEVKKISPRTTISVVKRIEQEYYLLTKDKPLEFSVDGPTYLRVYTRLLWQATMTQKESYKIIVSEDQESEKIMSFTSELSRTARGANRTQYGKWRSFYLEVPKGKHNYKLTLLEAKSETVAVRISFERPTEYRKIVPEKPYRELQFVEREKIIPYYEVTLKNPVKVKIEGPAILKVSCRLNYDYTMEGKQNYTIAAIVGGKEWQTKTFKASKSETGLYKNAPELIPSVASNMYLDIPPGSYLIEFIIKGTLAKSGALTFYYKPKEQYE